MNRIFIVLIVAVTGLTITETAHASFIVYVDAKEGATGNTFATGGSLANTSWVGPNGSGQNANQWNKRTVFGNGGEVFQGRLDSGTNNIPELTTQITGLSDGIYDVYTFFWDNGAGWSIYTGLTSGALTKFETGDAVLASSLSYTTDPILVEESRTLYAASIGQAVVSGGSAINVYIDEVNGGGSTDRTWYDGVGYDFVAIPEPSTVTMWLSLGLAMMGFRRRRPTR